MKQEQPSLTEELNKLLERRQSGEIGAASFVAKKRRLLRLPPGRVPSVIKSLLAALAVQAILLLLVATVPSTGRYVVGLAFFMLFGLGTVLNLDNKPGLDDDIKGVVTLWRSIRRVLHLDLADRPVRYTGPITAEIAGLRYLRDAGELSKQEYESGRAILDNRFKAPRWIAFVAFLLLVLNIALLTKVAGVALRDVAAAQSTPW